MLYLLLKLHDYAQKLSVLLVVPWLILTLKLVMCILILQHLGQFLMKNNIALVGIIMENPQCGMLGNNGKNVPSWENLDDYAS